MGIHGPTGVEATGALVPPGPVAVTSHVITASASSIVTVRVEPVAPEIATPSRNHCLV